MKWISILVFASLLFCSNAATAQKMFMRLGDYNLKKGDYEGAVEIYQKVLEKYEDHRPAIIKLAEVYRLLDNLKEAEYYYSKAVEFEEAPPTMMLEYAQILQRKNKCSTAKIWYDRYAERFPEEERAQLLKRSCDYQQELMRKNADVYEVRELWFNTKANEFSPTYFEDGIVFVSNRPISPLSQGWIARNDEPFYNLFKVKMAALDSMSSAICNYMYVDPVLLPDPLNSRFHEGSVAFTKDGNEAFLTRSGVAEEGFTSKGNEYVQLYYSKLLQGEWTTPELLTLNGEQYSVAHPALSPDGKYLYFASDMPGGYGGMDLYRIQRVDDRWGRMVNLGANINTEGNEIFPTLDATNRLYFASNGQIGLGGLDIYSVEEVADNEWSFPDNLGYPINTAADDFGIILNEEGTCGYFSSNRTGGSDDIYSFSRPTASVQILVYDDRTGLPLVGARVQDSCTQNIFYTNAAGKVILDMPLGRCCSFNATQDGYDPNIIKGCTEEVATGVDIQVEIPLHQQLNFELKGIVFDEYTGLPVNNSTVYLVEKCDDQVTVAVVTDASGRFTFPLKENCCYDVQATREDYQSKTQEGFCTKIDGDERLEAKVYLSAADR